MSIELLMEKIYKHIRLIYLRRKKNISIGASTSVRQGFSLYLVGGGTVEIGAGCFFNRGFSATVMNSLHIGDNSIFGENVKCYDHNHVFNRKDKLIKDSGFSVGSVYVGSNVWIGSNVILLKGTHIEDNCVIGCGCIIDGFVEQGTIVKRNSDMHFQRIRFQ